MAEEAARPAADNAAATDEAKPATADEKTEEPAAAADDDKAAAPVFDPESCRAIAIGLDAFWEGVHSGEWAKTDFRYYLEPAGVLNGPLVCSRSPNDPPQRAGLLMTRAGWQAKKVCIDDGINPETYELSFPKEFGYVKPLSHYEPETYEHARYPWSKKY